MATQDEKIALVREGRSEFEGVELGLEKDMASVDKIVAIVARGVPMGMLNGRRAKDIIADLMEVKTSLAKVSAKVHHLHGACTKIARENDADGELSDGFVVFGGGDR